MRHWLWFVVAGAVVVAGVVGAGFYIAPRLHEFDAGMKRVAVPGTASMEFTKPGSYTIFVEQVGAMPRAAGLSVRLVEEQLGQTVALTKPGADTTYSIGNRNGQSVWSFDLARPGTYRVTTALQGGRVEEGLTVAIGQGAVWGIMRVVFGALAIGMAGLAAGGAIAGITIWQRSKSNQFKQPTTEA
ncbi:MAG TPA: hypothetical protein VMI56_27945 [Reyranella sp.]|nr:hypothetical protein [Reyranella sp.]